MNPRLIAISGPLKGTVFALREDETSIGRESANRISISDLSLSRRHCVIRKEAGQCLLTDLESRNGTFVNGVPVRERLLEHGDHLRLGDSVFLFLLHEGEALPGSSPVQLSDDALPGGLTVRLRREEALYLDSTKLELALPPQSRTARDLNALLKIGAVINAARNPEALQRQLLELTAEVIPAERGAILLASETSDDFTPVFGWDRRHGVNGEVRVSRTIARQVLQEGVAILSNDVLEDSALVRTESIVASQTRSLLAVPLTVQDKTLGVIWLATSDPIVWFDADHLQLLTAIAAVAANALENLRRMAWLEAENQRLNAELGLNHNLIGESRRMHEVCQLIARVAPTDSTVLIRGESGTGKELAARAIHQNSSRADKPFVAINCAALTETLLDSELFGHEKGAFTGAIAQKKGKIEIAQGGTLFLDELGEMAPLLQVRLLRVLQEQEFERVGGTRTLKADIRVIAATNRDLEEAIRQGTFRQDLYYRLNVVTLTMPPLRERREDIPLLAGYFTAKYSEKCKRRVRGLSAEARAALQAWDWPGNVRELENAIERAVVLGTSDLIKPEDLPESVLEAASESTAASGGATYHEAVKEAKKQLIQKAFEQAGGSYTEAARLLGVHPNYLHRLIRNLNLKSLLK
jgi:Nif-specific regulatory protein